MFPFWHKLDAIRLFWLQILVKLYPKNSRWHVQLYIVHSPHINTSISSQSHYNHSCANILATGKPNGKSIKNLNHYLLLSENFRPSHIRKLWYYLVICMRTHILAVNIKPKWELRCVFVFLFVFVFVYNWIFQKSKKAKAKMNGTKNKV